MKDTLRDDEGEEQFEEFEHSRDKSPSRKIKVETAGSSKEKIKVND